MLCETQISFNFIPTIVCGMQIQTLVGWFLLARQITTQLNIVLGGMKGACHQNLSHVHLEACSAMRSILVTPLRRRSIAFQVLTRDNVALLSDTEIGTGSATTVIFDRHGEFFEGVPH